MNEALAERLADAVYRFKDYLLSERNLSDNSVDAYYSDIVQFRNYLNAHGEAVSLGKLLTLDTLDEYVISLSQASFESRSIQRKMSSLSLFFKFLKIEKYIDENPAVFLIRPKLGQRLPNYLTLEEVEAFIAVFEVNTPGGLRDRALYELMYSSGLRVSEAVALNVGDIYFAENIIKVTGKGDKQRFVPVGRHAVTYLLEYLEDGRSAFEKGVRTDALFLNYRGSRLTRKGIWKNLKAGLLKAGISEEYTVHTLRHSFATHLVQNGADIRYVQTFLGHKSINTTEIYTHLDMKQIKQVYDRAHIRH